MGSELLYRYYCSMIHYFHQSVIRIYQKIL